MSRLEVVKEDQAMEIINKEVVLNQNQDEEMKTEQEIP